MASNSTSVDAGRPPGGTAPDGAASTPLELSTSTGYHGEVVVVANGEVDVCTAATLLSELGGALAHPSCRTLIVDLRGVRFLGARGIGALLAIRLGADAHDVRLALVADHRPVLRPLAITTTSERFALFPTVAAARATA
jgi:anti-sigma B factor antagonist